jgi:hypothetical protein
MPVNVTLSLTASSNHFLHKQPDENGIGNADRVLNTTSAVIEILTGAPKGQDKPSKAITIQQVGKVAFISPDKRVIVSKLAS